MKPDSDIRLISLGVEQDAKWGRGVAAGLTSGIICGAILALVWLIFIIPGVALYNASHAGYTITTDTSRQTFSQGMTVDTGSLVSFVVSFGPSYGIFVGLWLAYNYERAKSSFPISEGFRYGTMFILPLAVATVLLVLVGSPVLLVIHLASLVLVGVVLFGILLSAIWNRKPSY